MVTYHSSIEAQYNKAFTTAVRIGTPATPYEIVCDQIRHAAFVGILLFRPTLRLLICLYPRQRERSLVSKVAVVAAEALQDHIYHSRPRYIIAIAEYFVVSLQSLFPPLTSRHRTVSQGKLKISDKRL